MSIKPLSTSVDAALMLLLYLGDLHFSKNIDKAKQLHIGSASMINNNIYNNLKSTPTAAVELENKNSLQAKEWGTCINQCLGIDVSKSKQVLTRCRKVSGKSS